jgi:hypothetical protein
LEPSPQLTLVKIKSAIVQQAAHVVAGVVQGDRALSDTTVSPYKEGVGPRGIANVVRQSNVGVDMIVYRSIAGYIGKRLSIGVVAELLLRYAFVAAQVRDLMKKNLKSIITAELSV